MEIDRLQAKLWVAGVAVAVMATGCSDRGGTAGSSLAGTWTLKVTVSDFDGTGTMTVLRSTHTVTAVEAGDQVSFSTGWCTLTARRTGDQLELSPNQRCTVPANAVLALEAQTSPGVFDAPRTTSSPYCYAIGSYSAARSPSSATALHFSTDGGAESGQAESSSCAAVALRPLSLVFDFSRS